MDTIMKIPDLDVRLRAGVPRGGARRKGHSCDCAFVKCRLRTATVHAAVSVCMRAVIELFSTDSCGRLLHDRFVRVTFLMAALLLRRGGAGRAGADDLHRRPASRRCAGAPSARHQGARAARAGGGRRLCHGVRNALPTVTYPNHTTLITGVWPAKHGIANNPDLRSAADRTWAAGTGMPATSRCRPCGMRCMTAGGKVASLSWPVSVGATSIDYNVPEYWRARYPGRPQAGARACPRRAWCRMLEKSTGVALADADGETVEVDVGRTRFAAALIAAKHPALHHRASARAGPCRAWLRPRLARGACGAGNAGRRQSASWSPTRARPSRTWWWPSSPTTASRPWQHEVNLIAPFIKAGLITTGRRRQGRRLAGRALGRRFGRGGAGASRRCRAEGQGRRRC